MSRHAPNKAKLFANGRSQAVRLPAEFRFEGNEVYIHRDIETGDVILSSKPNTWTSFLNLLDEGHDALDSDFLNDRQDAPAAERDLF